MTLKCASVQWTGIEPEPSSRPRGAVPRSLVPARRRGIAAVLAMLYLVLFAVLAIGFYAATATAVQISGNERDGARALLAAESGLSFMRLQLSQVRISPNVRQADLLTSVCRDLQTQLDGTLNLSGQSVGIVAGTIQVPLAADQFVFADDQSRFRASLSQSGSQLLLSVVGRHGDSQVSRSLQITCLQRQHRTSLFNCAVASKGQIYMKKGQIAASPDSTLADVMSASSDNKFAAINMAGGIVGGNLFVTTDPSAVALSGGSVGGTSNTALIRQDHVRVTPAPDFPIVDSTLFRQYATSTWPCKTGLVYKNLLVPKNTNPRFDGGDVIEGVLYIESPNTVTFRGHTTLKGIIVVESKGDTSVNILDMRGNVTQLAIPLTDEFAALRQDARGYALLAPTAALTMSGSTDSSLEGSLLLGSFDFAGSADLQINNGALITYNTGPASATFQGKNVSFTGSAKDNPPQAGLSYSTWFVPDASTYAELPSQ